MAILPINAGEHVNVLNSIRLFASDLVINNHEIKYEQALKILQATLLRYNCKDHGTRIIRLQSERICTAKFELNEQPTLANNDTLIQLDDKQPNNSFLSNTDSKFYPTANYPLGFNLINELIDWYKKLNRKLTMKCHMFNGILFLIGLKLLIIGLLRPICSIISDHCPSADLYLLLGGMLMGLGILFVLFCLCVNYSILPQFEDVNFSVNGQQPVVWRLDGEQWTIYCVCYSKISIHINTATSGNIDPQQFTRVSDIVKEPQKMLMPIRGYEEMPIVSLEEAVAPLISILPEIQDYAYVAKERCEFVPPDDLTQDESASIMLYSMEWEPHDKCLYFALNAALRTEDRRKLKPWFLYLKLILTALEKLPSRRCHVFRGVNLDLSNQYTKGKKFVWWGFSSCTTSIEVLENEQFLDKTGERTMFTIECDS
ncbi:unnamed protein product, partial [Adineta steineri]